MDETLSEDILNRLCGGRGLVFDRINPKEDLLLPPSASQTELDHYRSLLDHYAVRLLLKEIIKSENLESWRKGRRSVERFCHTEAADSFLVRLRDLGVITEDKDGRPRPIVHVTSFGPTYEWYVARILSSDFRSPAAWGVRFEEMGSGGDHDVISSVSGCLLYLEAKTAPPKHIEQSEVSGFIMRVVDTAPDIAVFHNDTHLRMKDKIVPMMEEAIEHFKVHPSTCSGQGRSEFSVTANSKQQTANFKRLEREIFHLDSCIYIVNSKPDLRRNLRTVFRHYFRSKNRVMKNLGKGIEPRPQ